MFCSDPMSGSHFIAQTSKFLLIDATAVTLGQGHGKVNQYIYPDPYILCAKYLKFSSNGFDVRGKSCCVQIGNEKICGSFVFEIYTMDGKFLILEYFTPAVA